MSDISDIILRIRVDITNSQALMQLVANMNKVQGASKGMKDQMDRTGARTSVWNKAFTKITGHLAGVERQLDAVFRAGLHMQSMGRDLLGFATKVGGAASSMVKSWGDFEFTLNRAAAASDIFSTQSPLYDALQKSVYNAAHELKLFKPEEVAKGLYFWQSTTGITIKTQKDLADQMKNVTSVMKAAAMTDTDYETAIKGVFSTLKQFHLPMKKTADVTSLLFYATQKTALEFPDLIGSLKMTGSIAGLAKEPLESVVAVLGAVGNAGFRGSLAGRALRQVYRKLVNPTDAAKKALDKLFKAQGGYNKQVVDSKGNFVGMQKYIARLGKATKDLTWEEKQHLFTVISTANAMPILMQMTGVASKVGKKWVDTFASQKKATDAFNKSWEILGTSWRGVIGSFQTAVAPIMLNFGKQVAHLLTPSIQQLTDVIWSNLDVWQSLSTEIVEAMRPAVQKVAAIFKTLVQWAAKNPEMVKKVAKWAIIGTIIAGIAGAVLLAAGTFTFLLANVILITIGMLPMIAAFVAVGAAVAVLAVKIYQNFDRVSRVFRAFGEAVARVFTIFIFGSENAAVSTGDLLDVINSFADKALNGILNFLEKLTGWLNKLTPEQVNRIKKIVAALITFIALNKGLNKVSDSLHSAAEGLRGVKSAAKGIEKVGSTVATGTANAAKGATGAVSSAASGIASVIAVLAPKLLAFINPVTLVVAAIAAIVTAAVAAYMTNFMGFRDFVDGLVSWFADNVLPVILGAVGGIADFVTNTLIPALQSFAAWFVDTWGPVAEQFMATLAAVADAFLALLGTIGDVLGGIGDIFGGMWDVVKGILAQFGIGIGDFTVGGIDLFKFFSDTVLPIVETLFSGIVNFVKPLLEGLANFITGVLEVIQGVFQVFSGILHGDWSELWSGLENIVDGFGDAIGGVIDALLKAAQQAFETGLDIIDGIFKGIFGDGPDSIYSHVKGFIDTIVGFADDVIGGFVGGIQDAIGGAITDVTGFFGDIIDGIKEFLGIHSPATIMLSIGRQIVNGLWKGINDAKDWIINKITQFVTDAIPGPIRDILGIKSPSRLMAGIGKNIVDGLASGIDKTDSAVRSMTDLTNSLTKSASDASTSIGVSGTATTNLSTTTDTTRKVELSVDVKSSDGSIDKVDMNTLADLITGSDMTNAIERMATVN